MNQAKNYITPTGFHKLQDELNLLIKKERPEITKIVTWAASLGDRSENADYIYGKKRLREIDSRIRFLQKRIDCAEVVDPSKVRSDKIQFGATVTIINLDAGEEKSPTIVGIDEIDSQKGHISWKSPIASAMLGKKVGDVFTVIAPSGSVEYEVLHILYKEIE